MAMRFARPPAIALVLLVRSVQLVRAESVGEISGRVTSATSGTALPAGLTITLDGYQQTERLPTRTMPVSSDGSFRFSRLNAGNEFAYVVQVEAQGVLYSSEPLRVQNGKPTISNFEIYAVTPTNPGIYFQALTRFVKSRSPDVKSIVEIAELVEPGDRAFVPTPRPDTPPPLRFGLPNDAFGLQPISNIATDEIVVGGPGFAVFRGFPPGVSMLVFGYQLALDNGRADLRWSPTLDTETAILLLETNSLNPDISGLKPLGADSFGSTDVTRWEANKITTGTSFEIRVVDTSEASIIRTLRGTTTDRWAIAISVPTLIFALGLVVWRRTWRHPPDPDPIDAAYILLEEIRASQAVSDTDPNATQTTAKTQLTELLFHHPTLLRRLRRTQRKQQGNGLSLN